MVYIGLQNVGFMSLERPTNTWMLIGFIFIFMIRILLLFIYQEVKRKISFGIGFDMNRIVFGIILVNLKIAMKKCIQIYGGFTKTKCVITFRVFLIDIQIIINEFVLDLIVLYLMHQKYNRSECKMNSRNLVRIVFEKIYCWK